MRPASIMSKTGVGLVSWRREISIQTFKPVHFKRIDFCQTMDDHTEIVKMPPPRKLPRTKRRNNQITTPPPQSPSICSTEKKSDVIEMFAIKAKPRPAPRRIEKPKEIDEVSSNYDSQDTSDISNDVFITKGNYSSNEGKSVGTNKSYRERINDRFKSMRNRAGTSTKKANKFRDITETFLLEKMRRESDDVNSELERIETKLKLNKRGRRNEFVDFFRQVVEENSEIAEETGDSNPTHFKLPENLKFNIQVSEQDLLFKPKALPVDIHDKISEDEPRKLQDEGFYIPSKLKIPKDDLNLLEQRLSRDSKKWFNCEGDLDMVESPIIDMSIRPQMKPTKDHSIFVPATISPSDECEEVIVVPDNVLKLSITNLKFNHHPLFSLEHVYAEKLRVLYQEYERESNKNTVERLKQTLKAMISVLVKLEESPETTSDKIDGYLIEIDKFKENLLEESSKERIRMKRILITWKRIKNLRETNKYSTTSVKLAIGKSEVDKNAEIESLNDFLELFESEDFRHKLRQNLKPPGEPKLNFILTENHEITHDLNNPHEITRRQVVTSTKFSLRILCNQIEVCKTKSVNLTQDFDCKFDEHIQIKLTKIPRFLTIQIIEHPKALIKRTVGDISIRVPAKNSGNKRSPKEENFEKTGIVHYKHEGVGSGRKLEEIDENVDPLLRDDSNLITSGYITYNLQWDINDDGKPTQYNNKIIDEIIGKNGEIDLDKLSEWLDQNQLDPQDPKNLIFYEYCTNNGLPSSSLPNKDTKYFRLNPHLKGFEFCEAQIIEENLRLTVLQLRNQNEPEFDRMIVPNRTREIPANILDDYKRRINAEKQISNDEDNDEEDHNEIEAKRNRGRRKLRQIYIKVFQKCRNSQNHLTFEDVVDEKVLVHFEKIVKGLVGAFMNWFKWKPLKQPSIKFKREPQLDAKNTWDITKTSSKIIIQVLGAINLPKKTGNDDEIHPFIEIDYDNVITRTSTGEGVNPIWNEELVLPLDSIRVDYLNPDALIDNLIIDLYDEGDKELAKYGGIKSRSWLGCVAIPLSAICSNGLQGLFKVRTPHLLLGYETELERNTKSPKTTHVGTQANQQTFLNLTVALEPNIPKMNPSLVELPCTEVPFLRDHIFKWNATFDYHYPNRKFSGFAIDPNGSTTCIIRYIKAVEPPQINAEGFDVTPEQCAKYISLIPFTESNKFYQSIWLPINQFLSYMTGSVIDHAVALTCYLLALKLEAWLLLGFGLPNASTAFVLVREYDNNNMISYYIFDVVSGEKFYLSDVFCPLLKVYCVVNDNNVWGNTQRGDNLSLLRFDFNRKSDWLPLFDNEIPPPSNSIQGRLIYFPQFEGVHELEMVLERKIRKKIAKLRQLDRTIWNHHVSNLFRNCLSSFENSSMFGKNNMENLMKIKSEFKTTWVKGLVLNLPFTSVSKIVRQVKSLGVHLQDRTEVEFASAVYMRSYPNQTIAVWIFLACFSIS